MGEYEISRGPVVGLADMPGWLESVIAAAERVLASEPDEEQWREARAAKQTAKDLARLLAFARKQQMEALADALIAKGIPPAQQQARNTAEAQAPTPAQA